ncbi:unnamed protein product [Strongylus vulgaris]|uniref:Ras-GEF domain-containing protein n=1 Tax=Strongylus vulgaris TaxID=40348 RepID=A0A3P7J8R1_STRVU|nr:unnamed protein product [Strongylus vulgaris]
MFTQNADAVNFCREGRDRMFSHLLRLCREWAVNIPHDFRSEHMRTRLNELLGLCSVDRNFKQKVADLQNTLKSQINKLERYDKAVKSLQKTLKESVQRPLQSDILVGLITVCPDPKTVAQQLTHIEMERFSMVGVDEILVALANNDLADLGRSRNGPMGSISFYVDWFNRLSSFTATENGPMGSISFYVDWFNRLSSFAATEVLRQLRKKHRVEVIEYLIDVAKECCEIGNFNSLMAIVAGLSLPAITRLKRTIVIPFFVLLLKDLFLVYHGSVRNLPNGHLNFVAYSQIAEQLQSVVRWKGVSCTFPKNAAVLQYLLVSPLYGEKESMLSSFECEPAESASEREQLKKLKVRS